MKNKGVETYISSALGGLPFCPGCGHTALLNALDKALVELQPDPSKVVIVTDIGCIGLSDRYFSTHAFHGLHGRSITYASGMKLARPELMVIVLMGDGGCGIGGTHLLNVARRNIGITLLIGNNFNYGMTGGQHSVTTPTSGITSSTPCGNLEVPMDLCATVAAAGGSRVSRATMFDKTLYKEIVQAIQHPGFSMLEVWELCTAYYVPRNQFRKKQMMDLLDNLGFRLGLHSNDRRPEYSAKYWAQKQSKTADLQRKPTVLEPEYPHRVTRQTGTIMAGKAGQKVKSVATLFAQASMLAGLSATQKDDYPITVQTGHSVSEVIISPQRIDYTGIDNPDYFVVISSEGLSRNRLLFEKLSRDCTVYADSSIDLPPTQATVRRLPIDSLGRRPDQSTLSMVALAAMLKDSGIFPLRALNAVVERFQSGKIAKANLQAIELGARLVLPIK